VTETTGQLLDGIANGLMIYGVCNEEEGRCWEHSTLCRNCFLCGWHELFQKAMKGDHEESEFSTLARIERVLRSFANQQIIRSKVQPKLDRQKFIDHYKQELIEAYESKLRNEFKCDLAGTRKTNDW